MKEQLLNTCFTNTGTLGAVISALAQKPDTQARGCVQLTNEALTEKYYGKEVK